MTSSILKVTLLLVGLCFAEGLKCPTYSWQPYNGNIPADAVSGGYDVYVGKVNIPNIGELPGTIIPHLRAIKVSARGQTFTLNHGVQILRSPQKEGFHWVYTHSQDLRDTAKHHFLIATGNEIGQIPFVGRVCRNNIKNCVVGKIFLPELPNQGLWYSWGNGELNALIYEVLSFSCERVHAHNERQAALRAAEELRKTEEAAEKRKKAEQEAEEHRKAEERRKAEEEAEHRRKAEQEAEERRKDKEEAEKRRTAEQEAQERRKAEELKRAEKEAEQRRKAAERAGECRRVEEEAERCRMAKSEAEERRRTEEEARTEEDNKTEDSKNKVNSTTIAPTVDNEQSTNAINLDSTSTTVVPNTRIRSTTVKRPFDVRSLSDVNLVTTTVKPVEEEGNYYEDTLLFSN